MSQYKLDTGEEITVEKIDETYRAKVYIMNLGMVPDYYSVGDTEINAVRRLKGYIAQIRATKNHKPFMTIERGMILRFKYKNYRGEEAVRIASVINLDYGSNEYHKTPCFLLRCYDMTRQAVRSFAVADMSEVEAYEPPALPQPKP